MLEEIERELRWTKEALALAEESDIDTPENSNAVHQQVVPQEYKHLLSWSEGRLRTHRDRLARDLADAQEIEYEEPEHIVGGDH
ncbi:hypothetical protein JMJ58_03820 [Haloterrigena salifodinae]|uniref:Uncharacterized protein n=1 Tax=Haloterrigena salifodinae TaxID=2675099 RepID=A0A8T8E371_9EURY|nr:hypothetical protein [Haloterrigena salifodinae]QRV16037.1 hypothetical protein JMJ58_03820 [Haloterrigena salifodinae]